MFHTLGERTSVKANQDTQNDQDGGVGWRQRAISQGKPIQLKIDVPLLIITVILLVLGMLMVYSASYDPSLLINGDALLVIKKQVLFMLIGIVAAGAMIFLDYRIWLRLALPAMIFTVVALVLVLIFGESRQGAVRTLFGGSVQPSELAKLVTVIYLAVWLYSKRTQLHSISFGLVPLAIILGILGGLIYVQPDLSAAITIIMLGGLMFFLAGGDLKQILFLGVVTIIVGIFVIQLSATGSNRIASYMAGIQDPMSASDHVRRSLEAFINGGFFGVGIGKGQTKLTGLPVPHTDSIFAVIGEEIGIVGAILVLILYTAMLWRGLKIARKAPDELGALLAAGLTIWITLEAFINMGVMVSLLPFAGNALPFISAGGSNLLVSLVAVGILLGISRLSTRTQEEKWKFFDEVINLRWRNWRGSISRSDRSGRANSTR